MRSPTSSSLQTLAREPHAARLGASWFAVVVVITMMVVAPFVMYLRGKAIRNRLTFEVGAMELSVERASRAMADRERALRAFIYVPERRRLEDYRIATATLDAALASAQMTAQSETDVRRTTIDRMIALAQSWDAAASGLIERAARGERDLLASPDTTRPGPLYDDFQGNARELLASLEQERAGLVREMGVADNARLALPLVLAALGIAVLLYVAWLSTDALRLLALARAEQQRLSRILEHMVDPVLVTDARGNVTLANPAARNELGIQPGTPILALAPRLVPFVPEPTEDDDSGSPAMAHASTATSPQEILDALASASPLASAEARIRRDGEDRPVSVSSAPIVIAGEIAGAVTVVRDLSDRVRYEQERLKSERFHALGAMAERIAHDFGNYLEAASAASAMLDRPSASDPVRRSRWVALIRTTIDEGRNVLSSLRTMSFISYRKPRFSALELEPMVVRAVEVARMARPDADIQIEQDVPSDVRVDASESDLVRAIVNVVVNAIDAMPRGGCVSVRASCEDGRVLLAIEDAGIGIPPEDHERIFDMYFTTKGDRGSGMGLALAREVVSLHGGEMRLESAPGQGSTFTLVLPRCASHRTADAPDDGAGGDYQAAS
ncbi:MAG: ATP-binding protein [Myxococcota bacterium]|nr:ATP-binding protein [Myxococcota bacterium]